MTIVQGKFLKPDGTAIVGATVQAFLNETAGESAGVEIYASNSAISTTSDSTGAWQLNLWSNNNGVSDTKYTFLITYTVGATPVKYDLVVPNVTSVFFSDLMISTSASNRAEELFNTEAGQYDFSITQSNSVRKKFEVLDSANQPMDLTGWQAKFTIKDTGSAFNLAVVPTITSLTGTIQLNLTSAQTLLLGDKKLIYELVIYSAQDVIKILYGNITVIPTFSTIGV